MSERENILGRVREALQTPAPPPGASHGQAGAAPHLPSPAEARAWLPRVGATFEERLQLFQKNAAELKADFHLFHDWPAVLARLLELARAENWQRVATHAGELADAASQPLGLPICRTDQAYRVEELERCDVGITQCDALVAQTGSVLVTNRSAGGRALSVLPPHHVVLARRAQLIGDLIDAFELLKQNYGSDYPSFMSLITGPSRTGDIERVLVLGAHGPRKLTILCF